MSPFEDGTGYITTGGRRISGYVPKSKQKVYPGDDYNGWQPDTASSASKWLDLCDKNKNKPITPSTKTTTAINLIKEWQEKDPDDKIIVFVKWTLTAKVLGRMLRAEKIPFLYYFGTTSGTSSKPRGRALEAFEDEQRGIKVMARNPPPPLCYLPAWTLA